MFIIFGEFTHISLSEIILNVKRTLNNLQLRSQEDDSSGKPVLKQADIIQVLFLDRDSIIHSRFQCFVKSVFYVGKGCGARSGQHIKEAFKSGKQQRYCF